MIAAVIQAHQRFNQAPNVPQTTTAFCACPDGTPKEVSAEKAFTRGSYQ